MLTGCPFRNSPPGAPSTPAGPTEVREDSAASYLATATDPDGDSVYIGFNYYLGDGSPNESSTWSTLVASGDTVGVQLHWWWRGTYKLRARALDVHGYYSEWSQWLTVTVH